MMPIIRAIELEVPVIGRSYSPAFLGWFSAIRNSYTRDYRCSSYTLGTLAFYACGTLQPVPQGIGIGVPKRQFLCQTSLLPLVKQSFVSLAREEIHAKWQEKRAYSETRWDTVSQNDG
jgi:hypothetical protein